MILVLVVAVRNLKSAMDRISKLILMLCLVLPLSLLAQPEKIRVIEEPEITEWMSQRAANIDTSQIQGFRIQIYFGSDMYKADEVKEKFMQEYPDFANEVYRKYEKPYWKIRVGNYYREIDAQPLLKQIETEYESVFIVKDFIEIVPLED